MKKWLKITLISLGSLLGVVLLVGLVALYLVFTPARLTGIVNSLSSKVITCENHFERVDLTLFKTFPNVGLEVKNAVLINPTEGYDRDTLAHMGSLTVGINLRDYLKRQDIKVEQVRIDGLVANAFIGEDGRTNFDIFPPSEPDTTPSEPFSLPDTISLKKLRINNVSLNLTDRKDGLLASVDEADLQVKGRCWREDVDAEMSLDIARLCCLMDSAEMEAHLEDISLALSGKGTLRQLAGELKVKVEQGLFDLGGEAYINEELHNRDHLLRVELPFSANLDEMSLELSEASLRLVDYAITLSGNALLKDTVLYDVDFTTNRWHVAELLPLLPPSIAALLPEGMDYDAQLALAGNAKPELVCANLCLDEGRFAMPEALPYPIRDIDANIDARLDLSERGVSSATINSFNASAQRSRLSLTGRIDDLLGQLLADVRLRGDVQLTDVQPFLPDSLSATGRAKLDLRAKANLEQITTVDLKRMKINGSIEAENLDVNLEEDILAQSPRLRLEVQIPAKRSTESFREMLSARVTAGELHAEVRSSNIDARLSGVELEAGLSDVMDEKAPLCLNARLKGERIVGDMDSIAARIAEPDIRFEMVPRVDDPSRVHYYIAYNSSALTARMSDSLSVDVAGLSISGTADYDSTRANVLQQWGPNLNVDLKRAYVRHEALQYVLQVPDIKFNYKPERCEIASANIVFGNSDYYLSGAVTGLEKWLSHEEMLRGDLHFTSNYTNVDDLLAALSGLGSDPDSLEQQRVEDNVAKEANPFIVPKDVDFTLHTRIKDCTAFGNDLQELAGDIMVKDGVAVLDQVGFVCKAATMQLTALYRTPRVNHIFLGMDFHLLNINVSELIDMIPMVDTIVPMLSAFEGRADFHLCAETYVDAFYQPKYSTLRGAASIKGDSLVVLDNETFETISKLLMFKKKTRNVIDSLDVQLTVFRKEVELFPFLLSMDKYQVVAAGRHTLDNHYNYHLEILQSPLPTRLAVDALGVMPKIGIKLSKCRYDNLYRPAKADALEKRTMEFKRLIHQSLEANVREETRQYQGLE